MSEDVYKLSDSSIGQIAKLLQLAILSGTDVVDHLRTLKLVAANGNLELEDSYKEQFEKNLESMLGEVEDHAKGSDGEKYFN
tara:strand:+ start:1652 stop:1897 length:246 start_codon:yes stop_codon:yes gene_type:complete